VIRQGDVYWVDLGSPRGSGPGFRHPHVVVQSDLFNRSRLNTTVICVITSNLARAEAPGNLLLSKGEANLPKKSVVNVTQLFTVDKSQLVEKIGTLPARRVSEILDGIALVLQPRDIH
jgi:mRNA interferase MazF